jgi:hypothetical protein
MSGPRVHKASTKVAKKPKVAKKRKRSSKTIRADSFLREFLHTHGESWERDVLQAADVEGFTQDQIRRARCRLNITLANGCVRKMGLESGWKWRLPEDGNL